MSYTLKDVFYLGATHEYASSTYNAAAKEGNIPIDISAYVDPIAKGRQRGQGLAVYKVHAQVAGDSSGSPPAAADAGQASYGLSVKPYSTSGDDSGAIDVGDLTPESDLLIWGSFLTQPGSLAPGQGGGGNSGNDPFVQPSKEVPYVAVRDTIFQLFRTSVGLSTDDSVFISYRMECAMITLDTATLNQLLRTQTA
jgi:hypothetical protein